MRIDGALVKCLLRFQRFVFFERLFEAHIRGDVEADDSLWLHKTG